MAQLRGIQFVHSQAADTALAQQGLNSFAQTSMLTRHHLVHPYRDGGQLLRRCQVGRIRPSPACALQLLQPPHPYHKKLIGVGRRDGQELQPLQRRQGWVFGLLQYAEIKFDPTQFPV